ncbi:hypothetical protein FRC14_002650 [Serendipita sp. 396]|nr:hypothetical protein FRC14_002650 [Serendipita sp. 396]KAG8784576.1 hypothetical protein FRC15_003027 [Serendipita sp. 397]KAG8800188.1 hypothetical protein FRC16_003437 [Serendipita sp. 398]KAG8817545.1 hypothetical protein FRC19_011280 [Serendipita sp. 401]
MDNSSRGLVTFESRPRVKSLDLGEILVNLSAHIGDAMSSLYDQQKAAMVSRTPFDSIEGSEFRRKLKQEWEKIAHIFQRFREFNELVQLFINNILEMTTKLGLGFLTDMATISSSLVQEFNQIQKNIDIESPYCRHGSNLARSVSRSYQNSTMYLLGNLPRAGDIALSAARRRFNTATRGITGELKQLSVFWEAQNAFIKKQAADIEAGIVGLSQDEAQRYAERWSTYDEKTLDAIKRVNKVCDVIMIEPEMPFSSAPPQRLYWVWLVVIWKFIKQPSVMIISGVVTLLVIYWRQVDSGLGPGSGTLIRRHSRFWPAIKA